MNVATRRFAHFTILLLLLIVSKPVAAENIYWTNNQDNNVWEDNGNWEDESGNPVNAPDANTPSSDRIYIGAGLGDGNKAILSTDITAGQTASLVVRTGSDNDPGQLDIIGAGAVIMDNRYSTIGSKTTGIVNMDGTLLQYDGSSSYPFIIGGGPYGRGTLNVTNGTFEVLNADLRLGGINNKGILSMQGGAAYINGGVEIGPGNGNIIEPSMIEVVGTSTTTIRLGETSGGDKTGGNLSSEGILRFGIDGTGVTQITVSSDDLGEDGDVTFASTAVLDPYDAGGTTNQLWYTVLSWEGDLTDNGLSLTQEALDAGWESRFDNNTLQVRLAIPEPATIGLALLGSMLLISRRSRNLAH